MRNITLQDIKKLYGFNKISIQQKGNGPYVVRMTIGQKYLKIDIDAETTVEVFEQLFERMRVGKDERRTKKKTDHNRAG